MEKMGVLHTVILAGPWEHRLQWRGNSDSYVLHLWGGSSWLSFNCTSARSLCCLVSTPQDEARDQQKVTDLSTMTIAQDSLVSKVDAVSQHSAHHHYLLPLFAARDAPDLPSLGPNTTESSAETTPARLCYGWRHWLAPSWRGWLPTSCKFEYPANCDYLDWPHALAVQGRIAWCPCWQPVGSQRPVRCHTLPQAWADWAAHPRVARLCWRNTGACGAEEGRLWPDQYTWLLILSAALFCYERHKDQFFSWFHFC